MDREWPRRRDRTRSHVSDEPRWVDDDVVLADVISALRDEPRYALDTEFHRERTYHPKVALVQLAWLGGIVLVDALAVDMLAFAPLFAGLVEVVVYAAQQDLDVLGRVCGTVPA